METKNVLFMFEFDWTINAKLLKTGSDPLTWLLSCIHVVNYDDL